MTMEYKVIFKPGMHGQSIRIWFLEIALAHALLCMCVRPQGFM